MYPSDDVGHRREFISYLTLRRIVGMLGVLLPVVLALGCIVLGKCSSVLESISAYQGTIMRDVFAGTLFTVGWFLFSYKGYEPKDDKLGDLGGLFALGVALFPITSGIGAIRLLHNISAALLFLVFAYFSLVLFTKTTAGGQRSAQKKKRDTLYRACGVIMVLCVALVAVYNVFLTDSGIATLQPVFWLETIALWAFGVSWVTKGKTLWKD